MDLGLNKLPWWGQLALYVVVGAGLVATHHYMYAVDLEAKVSRTHAERRKIETGIARARVEERRLPEFRSRVAELNARLAALRNVLPEQKDVGDLLRRIQTLATQSSLTIRGFKPQAVAQRQQHAEWPISLQLEGTYHDLGAFASDVAKMPRIVLLTDLKIDPPRDGVLSMEAVAKTYRYLDEEEVSKQRKTAKEKAATGGKAGGK